MSPRDQDGIAVDADPDSQFLAREDEVGHILRPGPEQVHNSQTVNCDEQLLLAHRDG
jgi:hypothetical protein